MSSLKDRISAPLEAGTSILDAQHLPPHVDEALQYASKRLARKGVSVTLVVVRREEGEAPEPRPTLQSRSMSVATSRDSDDDADGVIPIMLAPTPTPGAAASAPPRTPRTPRRPSIMSTALGRLGRSSTQPILPTTRPGTAAKGALKRSVSSGNSPSVTPLPRPPATPAMSMSAASTDVSGTTQTAPNPFGIHLVHTQELDPRDERVLRQTIDKAERKFGLGTDWLPQAVGPAERGLADLLVSRSVLQNEVLFSADGLTLLSLDHLYTFKRALAAYTRSGCHRRLEDAVDELRRCVLANGRRRLQRSQLMRVYPGLSFAEHALLDVAEMYRRAYGGPTGDTGIECDPLSYNSPFYHGGGAPVVAAPTAAPAPAPTAAPSLSSRFSLSPPPPSPSDNSSVRSSSPSSPSSSSSDNGSVQSSVSSVPTSIISSFPKSFSSTRSTRTVAPPRLPPLVLGESASQIISQAVASAGISEKDADFAAVSRTGEFVRSERMSVASSPAAAATLRSSTYSSSSSSKPAAAPAPAPALKLQTSFAGGRNSAPAPAIQPAAAAAAAAADGGWESQIGVAITTGEWDAPESALSGEDVDLDDYYFGAAAADDGSLTARPSKRVPKLVIPDWKAPATTTTTAAITTAGVISLIDEVMLSPFGVGAGGDSARNSAQFPGAGPAPPQAYDDVSPITRGEWEFLMGAGDAWKARTVAVETC